MINAVLKLQWPSGTKYIRLPLKWPISTVYKVYTHALSSTSSNQWQYLTFALFHFSSAALCAPSSYYPSIMVMISQRTLRLRTALRHLYSPRTVPATPRCSPARAHNRFLSRCSSPFLTPCRALHVAPDGPESSPGAPPGRLPFSRVTEEDLAFFRKILPGRTITDPDLLESSNVDWLKSVKGELKSWNQQMLN